MRGPLNVKVKKLYGVTNHSEPSIFYLHHST